MPELPFGTVTFLFTDIEGSTRLWEQHPDQMRRALLRHDSLAEEIITEHGGSLIKERGEGDSLFAVFALATDAVEAVCALQLAFWSESWPLPQSLRVRMALHTGEADLRDDGYYGVAVNRCARLRGIGHGGQVLISRTTYDLVRDCLPDRVSLKDAGDKRLRDLTRPEQVFQLLHPELPSDFPPLTSLDALPNNLPQQLTSFIGRQKEMTEIKSLLGGTRLLTLTGSGGCGKTRVALQVAADQLESYPDGVWLVGLAALTDPALVPQAVVSAVNIREEPGKSLIQTLCDNLKDRRLLLTLDNCEHLLEACAELADTLLRASPNLRILATSREALGIAGEQAYRVPSLALPDEKRDRTSGSLGQYESVQLFVERALMQNPNFAVTNENAASVAAICHRLDGIPLAIELAAARVRSLTVEDIHRKLDQRFRLLTGGSRTALPRQQTLRSLVDWSYNLLNDQERALLCRLSVFSGGWTAEAAEAICSGEPVEEWEILDLLTSLVDKSLVIADTTGSSVRYRLLETIRQYGHEKLAASGELGTAQQRHLNWFLALAEEAAPKLRGAPWVEWLKQLEEDLDNIRNALTTTHTESGCGQEALRLAASMAHFWYIRGYWGEGRAALLEALAHPGASDRTAARGNALIALGGLLNDLGDYTAEEVAMNECLSIRRGLGDDRGTARVLIVLATRAAQIGDNERSDGLSDEALTLARRGGDQRSLADVLDACVRLAFEPERSKIAHAYVDEEIEIAKRLGDHDLLARALTVRGKIALGQSEYGVARGSFERAFAVASEHQLTMRRAAISTHLGNLALVQGDILAARGFMQDAVETFRDSHNRAGHLNAQFGLACVELRAREDEDARKCFTELLRVWVEIGDTTGVAGCLECLALVAATNSALRSARLLGAAAAIRDVHHSPPPSPLDRRAIDYEETLSTVRASLGSAGFDVALQEGRAMTMEQAVEYALSDPNA